MQIVFSTIFLFTNSCSIIKRHYSNMNLPSARSGKFSGKEDFVNNIEITGAYEGNLKNISLTIPKNQLVVFTGLSGSGKSTLLIDVLFNECQRQYLEAMAFQGIHKPKMERIRGASPAIVISQTYGNQNPRSTVGTMTDVYTDLRMIYEKLGVRACPYCGAIIP